MAIELESKTVSSIITEKFNPNIIIKESIMDLNTTVCEIGNSGLFISIVNNDFTNETECYFDYLPYIGKNENDKRAQKATIFGASILSFKNWLNNPETQKKYSFSQKTFPNLSNCTNEKMANYIRKLFSENNHPEIVNFSENIFGFNIVINLRKFCKLPETDKLIRYLTKLSERAKRSTLTYDENRRFLTRISVLTNVYW